MSNPFRRDHTDAERLNDLLDTMRSGMRAPDASADEANDLARTARQFRGLADRAASTDPAPATTFDAIWEDMMSAHAISAPTPVDIAPATPITPETHRVPTVRGMPQQSRWQSLLSAAIVALMIAGIIATAWSLRGTGGGGTDPGENARLAATALQDGTPEASPTARSNEWLTWVQPEECIAEPMTTEEYAEIMREEPDISGRSYEVVGPADPETAEAAASAARAYEACQVYGSTEQQRSLQSERWIFFASFSANRTISSEHWNDMNLNHGKLLSETMPAKPPSSYATIIHEEPPAELINWMRMQANPLHATVFLSLGYEPDNAVILADGRLAIPATILYWSGGDPDGWYAVEQWQIDESTSLSTYIVILSDESGSWKVDEQLRFCPFDDCDWEEEAMPATHNATPVATPED